MGELTAGDNGVPQHHRIGAGFGSGNTKGLLHGSCIPQQGGGSRQVGTGRKANDGDLIRRNAQIRRIPAQVQDGGRGFGQRLPQQRGVVGGINQGEHMVAGLQKLDGNRVRFARGAVAVAAAGQDQHCRAGVVAGHFGGFVTQVAGQHGTGGKFMFYKFHNIRLLMINMKIQLLG